MAFLIGLTGTHGTGKSTVLKALEDAKYAGKVDVTERLSLSRLVQARTGVTMTNIHDASFEAIMVFQEEILREMVIRDLATQNKKDIIVVVDRTPIDLAAYTMLWGGRAIMRFKAEYFGLPQTNTRASEMQALVSNYVSRALSFAVETYQVIRVFPIREQIPFIEEEGRGSRATREELDGLIRSAIGFIRTASPKVPEHMAEVLMVQSLSVENRVQEILHGRTTWQVNAEQ